MKIYLIMTNLMQYYNVTQCSKSSFSTLYINIIVQGPIAALYLACLQHFTSSMSTSTTS